MYRPFMIYFIFFACLAVSQFASAQLIDVSACRGIEDRLERLECYESLVQESDSTSVEENPEATIPREAQDNSSATERVDLLGQPEKQSSMDNEESNDNVLLATIASLEVHNFQQWLIILENGQVWRQMISRRFNLKVGDSVRIAPSRWGADYRLMAPHLAGYIQVERIE